MKNKVLIIFKYPREQWNTPIINKFSNFYDIEYLYISDYKNKNFTEIVNEIYSLARQWRANPLLTYNILNIINFTNVL